MGTREKPNKELTSREKDALKFIAQYLAEHQKMPTMKEVAIAMGASSPNAGQGYVTQLRRKGFLEDRKVVVDTLSPKARQVVRRMATTEPEEQGEEPPEES